MDFIPQVTASVTGSLPALANSGCYFAAAYLTTRMPGNCTWDMYEDADVRFDDVIVGTPICFHDASKNSLSLSV